jgi:hypothetical protein
MYLELLRKQEKLFPSLEKPEAITGLKVWICKYRSLAPIAHCSNLKSLVINSPLDSDLSWISKLTRLEYLWVQNPKNISSIGFLENLKCLQTLSLSTPPSWDSAKKILVVNAFTSIAHLERLKHIELFGVCGPDKSLAALRECRELVSARFNGYPEEVVVRFYSETGVSSQFAPEPKFD